MLSTNSTNCSFWDYDDTTSCWRHQTESLVPIVLGSVSLTILALKSASSIYRHKLAPNRIKLPENDEEGGGNESRPLLANRDAYGAITTTDESSPQSPPLEVSVKDRHFSLNRIPDTNEDGSLHGVVQFVYKSGGERFRVALEFLLVLIQFAYTLSLNFVPSVHKEFKHSHAPLIRTVFWVYILMIVFIRVLNMKRVVIRMPSLWVHSTTLYFFNFFSRLLPFRSAILNHIKSPYVRHYYYADFWISFALLVLNFTAKNGDKPATLYVTTDGVKPSPENVTSLWLFITYSWIDSMVWRSYKQELKMNDIWGLRQDDYARTVLNGFEAAKSTLKFSVRLFVHFKWLFAIQAFWAVLQSFIVFLPSILLKRILEYVEDPTITPKSVAWSLVFMLPAVKILDAISSGCSLYVGRRVCLRMKAIIIGEVYAKALRRKITVTEVTDDSLDDAEELNDKKKKKKDQSKSKGEEDLEEEDGPKSTAELGAIINLMAIDAFKVSEICGYLHYFVGAFLMIIICVCLLYGLLGWSALLGSLSIIVLLPVNYKIASYSGDLQKEMLAITDKRIQKLNETFQSIRIIKFFAWEDKFAENVMKIRANELKYLTYRTFVWAGGSFIWFITPTLVTMISFYCYTIVEGNTLTAPIAFTALSLFTLLRSPLDQLSDMTSFVMQSKVSLDRIDEFLDEEETTKYDILNQQPGPNSPYIGFEDASFSWNSKSETDFKLRDLNVSFLPGKLNVVIGATGSGKTSLLLALLGEMNITKGKVFLPGTIPKDELTPDSISGLTDSVAYCSQSPWLLNDTIKNNIIFGSHLNEDRYKKVIEACGLARDLEILSAGDATEIGEKGITLSGGQKQRVSLARALYSNSKHVLLDDCLSAVDSHTALWIYENCISGPLMIGRTCILVSHNVALTIQNAEWIVVMENGRVKNQGHPEDLLKTGDLGDDDLIKSSVINSRNQSSTNLPDLADKNADLKSKAAAIEDKLKKFCADEDAAAEDLKKSDGKLTEEETKADGAVGFDVYAFYAKFLGGLPTIMAVAVIFFAANGIYILQSWWLRNWANQSELENQFQINAMARTSNVFDVTQFKGMPFIKSFDGGFNFLATGSSNILTKENTTMYYIIIYALIGVLYSIMAVGRVFSTFYIGLVAANKIFKELLDTILRAKLRFFDKTPIGRIMNRFLKDVESVDQELTPFGEAIFACLVQCVSTLILITYITPGFLVFAIIISFLYYLVGFFYLTLSRELKRYESVTKSPIHQHFSESLTGVATIRAYGVESRFMKQNLEHIDNNNRPFFYLWVANRWLSLRVDFVGAMVMMFSGVFILLSLNRIDAGLAGLSLSYSIAFSESALWIVRFYSNFEMNMNSVERLKEYLQIEQEPPYEIPETQPEDSWPQKGEIIVEDVSLRYAPDLPRVIKDVSFKVEPCHKVGIVGRTGAGKSTIITAFFRFLDPESGSIKIDNIDITSIGLKNLRRAITIIPQDPTLFSGTIRTNLDPFVEYSDEAIYAALRRVNLISADDEVGIVSQSNSSQASQENQNKFLNLYNPITEGGGNLSQGERQLVCLARSLLKNPKVMLLDEATSSIDYKSDAIIQKTIREEFHSLTILTIAHRLRTIIDYDMILVMDAGRVVEYENPYVLISNRESLFYSMCENSGELDTLIKLAKEAYVEKKNSNRN